MALYYNCTCKSSSTLTDSNIFRNLVSSSKIKWKCNTHLFNCLNGKPADANDRLNLERFLLYHIVLLKCWQFTWEGSFSGEDCEQFAVLVTKMVYVKVFEDKQWVQNSSTTVVYIFHFAVNISLKNAFNTALSVLLLANLFY